MKQSPINLPPGPRSQPRGQRFFARAPGAGFDVRAINNSTTIDLFDEIGTWGVSAAAFRERLNQAGRGDVTLRVNSPGGDVFDGVAIYNSLVAHPGRVDVEIVGLAASAASIIAMAGDHIKIAANSFLMVHQAWGVTVGNADDHAEMEGLLGKIDDALAATYALRTGAAVTEMAKLMADETWLAGQAAVDAGFADEVSDTAPEASARFDLSVYAKAPPALSAPAAESSPPDITNPVALEKLLRSAGLSRRQAKAISQRGWGGLANAETNELNNLSARIAAATAELERI